jgi:hypothetical protein
MSPNFNEAYAAITPKEQWVKEHEHMLGSGFDLEKEWESAQSTKEVAKPEIAK